MPFASKMKIFRLFLQLFLHCVIPFHKKNCNFAGVFSHEESTFS